jgi:hypothetical protein
MSDYPCKGCILLGNCSAYCSKVITEEYKIARIIIHNDCCCDCGGTRLLVVNAFDEVLVCEECRSVFYPIETSTGIELLRLRKALSKLDKPHTHTHTTFGKWRDDRGKDYGA